MRVRVSVQCGLEIETSIFVEMIRKYKFTKDTDNLFFVLRWREFATRAILQYKMSDFRDLLIEAIYGTKKSIKWLRHYRYRD